MSLMFGSVAAETEAYAAYHLNTPRGILSAEEQQLFDEDLAKARAAMRRAWLESLPLHPASYYRASITPL
jgi:hypothetical protein